MTRELTRRDLAATLRGRSVVAQPHHLPDSNVVVFPQSLQRIGRRINTRTRYSQLGPLELPCCNTHTSAWFDRFTHSTQPTIACPSCGTTYHPGACT